MRGVLARLAGVLIFQACFWTGRAILDAHEPRNVSTWTLAGDTAWLVAAYLAGMVAHELGHAAAVRLTGSRVDEIEFGGHWVRFRVRGVQVSAWAGPRRPRQLRLHPAGPPPPGGSPVRLPAANVLAAPLCFLLPVPRWDAAFIALSVFSSAARDLVPDTDDLRTDGAKLTRIPATIRAQAAVRELVTTPDWPMQPGTADTLIEGFLLDVPEAEDILRELSHDPVRLLPFFRQDWTLPDKPEAEVLHIVDVLTWKTLCTSELPAETVDSPPAGPSGCSRIGPKTVTTSESRCTSCSPRSRSRDCGSAVPLTSGGCAPEPWRRIWSRRSAPACSRPSRWPSTRGCCRARRNWTRPWRSTRTRRSRRKPSRR